VEAYLRAAALVTTKVGSKLDPWILATLGETNFDAPKAVKTVATFPYRHSPGIVWMAERLEESARLLAAHLRRKGHEAEDDASEGG
jgi:hypothetical protein